VRDILSGSQILVVYLGHQEPNFIVSLPTRRASKIALSFCAKLFYILIIQTATLCGRHCQIGGKYG